MTPTDPHYPIPDHLKLVDEGAIRDFLDILYGAVRWKAPHFVCVRGIGEKGTPQEGKHQEDLWAQPGLWEFPDEQLGDMVVRASKTWAQYNVAAFIVPAVLKEARGRSEAVELFTSVVVDLDSGDTGAKAAWLEANVGTPTMVVTSGGTTEAGTPKLHVYYVFEDAVTDVGAVVELRHMLAVKCGGDLQFGRGTPDNPYGRAHQPIRIPGSVHAKGGNARPCQLLWDKGPRHDADELGHRIRRAAPGPWAPVAQPASGAFDFGPTKNNRPDIADSLLNEVREGGEDKTRWTEFNRVAGFHIAAARRGDMTLDQAKADTMGWMLAKMVPPWPEARFDREWHALLQKDVAKRGAMPTPAVEPAQTMLKTDDGLREWAVHRWTQDAPGPRRFLVEGLILAGKPHLLVAEGGAGKTFSMLDLGLKVATHEEGGEQTWWGQRILEGGTVVMLTTEDDADELHIRIAEFDREGRRYAAGDRWIVAPLTNMGGAFTLGERDRNTGNVVPSSRWLQMMDALREVKERHGLAMVVVDTLNTTLHGEENSATVVNEYVKMIQPICGELGAALVVTHHIRKQDSKDPITKIDDMAAAVRGSSALPAAFRAVLGIWHCHDFAKRMIAMGLQPEPKMLWRMGVLKANNPEMVKGVRFLLRQETGLLEDVTHKAAEAAADARAEVNGWLVAAIKAAAEAGYPFASGSKNDSGGLYLRRSELPEKVAKLGWKMLDAIRQEVMSAGLVVACAAKGSRTRNLLDVPDGPFASSPRGEQVAGGAMPAVDWSSFEWRPEARMVVPKSAPRIALTGQSVSESPRTGGVVLGVLDEADEE